MLKKPRLCFACEKTPHLFSRVKNPLDFVSHVKNSLYMYSWEYDVYGWEKSLFCPSRSHLLLSLPFLDLRTIPFLLSFFSISLSKRTQTKKNVLSSPPYFRYKKALKKRSCFCPCQSHSLLLFLHPFDLKNQTKETILLSCFSISH